MDSQEFAKRNTPAFDGPPHAAVCFLDPHAISPSSGQSTTYSGLPAASPTVGVSLRGQHVALRKIWCSTSMGQ